jgi:hypothetical protein
MDPGGPAAKIGYIGNGDVLFEVGDNRWQLSSYLNRVSKIKTRMNIDT